MTAVLDEPRLVADKPERKTALDVELGDINFKDINFWHTDGNVKTQVFRNFNLQIPAGQRVGLVGVRRGEDDAHEAAAALGRHPGGKRDPGGWPERGRRDPAVAAPPDRLRLRRRCYSTVPLPRTTSLTAARCYHGRIREAARAANALEFIEDGPGLRYTITGERGIKPGRPAPAHRHRPRHAGRLSHPRAGMSQRAPWIRKRGRRRRPCRLIGCRTAIVVASTAFPRWRASTASSCCPRDASWRTAPMPNSWPRARGQITPASGTAKPAPSRGVGAGFHPVVRPAERW